MTPGPQGSPPLLYLAFVEFRIFWKRKTILNTEKEEDEEEKINMKRERERETKRIKHEDSNTFMSPNVGSIKSQDFTKALILTRTGSQKLLHFADTKELERSFHRNKSLRQKDM